MKPYEKNALYQRLLIMRRELYRDQKVKIPFLEVWVGQTCTLRCRECCHLIPQVWPRLYDVQSLLRDLDQLLQVCEIAYFSIAGGEPFCNRDLDRLLWYVASKKEIPLGKIVTNGTVMPDARTLEALQNLEGKLSVHVNQYPGSEAKAAAFYETLKSHGIPAQLSNYQAWSWKIMNTPGGRSLDEETVDRLFGGCWIRECNSLAEGELTLCPRGITTWEACMLPKNPYEHVRIADWTGVELKARISIAIDPEIPKDYCVVCRGMCEENDTKVVPGEQKA